MAEQSIVPRAGRSAPISPAAHAVLDYAVAATFFGVGAWLMRRHRAAASLAFANGAMVAGMSMLTDYPGGVVRVLPFRGHRDRRRAAGGICRLGARALRLCRRRGSQVLLRAGRERGGGDRRHRLGRGLTRESRNSAADT